MDVAVISKALIIIVIIIHGHRMGLVILFFAPPPKILKIFNTCVKKNTSTRQIEMEETKPTKAQKSNKVKYFKQLRNNK